MITNASAAAATAATTATGGTASTGSLTNALKGNAVAGGELGKDAFLKLLTTQLQNQDPMSPMDDMSFIGQMAQFSSLEQTTNMAKSLESFGVSQQIAQSIGLIGRNVEAVDDEGNPVSGTVSAVTIVDGATIVDVEGTMVSGSSVTKVGE
jgi:flagellar basal-body rod modification protein FlgD